jgi:LacI family transcriptional regulator
MTKNLSSKKTTVADIAAVLKLSNPTVAAALSGGGGNTRVSEETRVRVRQMAAKMNYQLNTGARSLRTRRFHNIGYFSIKKAPGDYTFAELILDGLSDGADEHGQNVVLVRIPDSSERFEEIPRALREQCLDALIISDAATFPPGFQDAIEAGGIPVVYLNEKQPTNAVYIDDRLGGRLMTEHLIGQGFRHIAMLAPDYGRNHYSFGDRIIGYKAAMKAAGRDSDVKRYPSATWRAQAKEWMMSADRPDAVFCVGDFEALMLQRILYDLRLRVPDDIAVAGCNGEMFSLYSTVPLTTLEIPFRSMTAQAFKMALDLVADPAHKPIPSIVLEPRLIQSQSTLFTSR